MGVAFSKKIAVLAGVSAMFLASPALATTYPLGTLTPGVITGGGGFIGPSNTSDHWTFSLGIPSDTGGSANISPVVFGVGLTSLSAKFYAVTGNQFLGELIAGQTKTFVDLIAGDYYVDVTGTSVGNKGGSYSLSVVSQAAAAPGPAGFLFVGGAAALMASRRRRQKAKLDLGEKAKLALA